MNTRDEFDPYSFGLTEEQILLFFPLSTVEQEEVENLCQNLNAGNLDQIIEIYKNENNLDQLAKCAYLGCYQGDITAEQLATVLELRSILMIPDLVVFLRYSTNLVIQKINDESSRNIHSTFYEFFKALYANNNSLKAEFINNLELKPKSEHHIVRFGFLTKDINDFDRFKNFIYLAYKAKVCIASISNNFVEIVWLCPGARDAMTKAYYGEQAKKSIYQLGRIIDRNAISSAVELHGRPIVQTFPGVVDPLSFHSLETPFFFNTMHDEIHRQAISALPNPAYDAIVHNIHRTRELSGRDWSKEIWNMTDMDFVSAGLPFEPPSRELTPQEVTEYFIKALSASNVEGEQIAALMPTAYCDTTWMFLIDLYKNEEQWGEFSINAEDLPAVYRSMFNFICKNQGILDDKNFANQILRLKCSFLKIDVAPKKRTLC